MILVTGGLGFIGSHTVVELVLQGDEVLIVDNLCNCEVGVLDSIEKITGKRPLFFEGDIRDTSFLDSLFHKYPIQMVVHFAALKAVGQSLNFPLEYYSNNIAGTISLLEAMKKANVKKIVFSSSATVYGDPKEIPITEQCPVGKTTSPYGQSKIIMEKILEDVAFADKEWSVGLLRYFNPIGAHESGLIGDNPKGEPENLAPYICQVISGDRPELSVYGNDYPTPDGTGVRDYIHVVDLAKGHLRASKKLREQPGVKVWNLGTGKGYSVLEVIHTFEKVLQNEIPYKIRPRRTGDIAECWADCSKAKKELGWEAHWGLERMVSDCVKRYMPRQENIVAQKN